MKHLYKTSLKDFIKQHYKTIGDILLWIGLMLCVTLCAIYYTRVNINLDNENRESNTQLVRRDLISEGFDFDYVYKLKSKSFVETSLSYENNTNDYKSYFDMDFENWPQSDTTFSMSYVFEGDFYLKINKNVYNYTSLTIGFLFDAVSHDITLKQIYCSSPEVSTYVAYWNGTYNATTIRFKSLERVSYNHLKEYQQYGVIKYLFEEVLDASKTSVFKLDFSQNPNFNQLLTYYRVGVYDFTYTGNPSGSWYTLPITFLYNNVLYESIMFNTIYVVNYLADSQTIKHYSDITGDATQYIMTCSSVYFVEYGGTTHVQSDTGGNVMRPPTLVGDCLQVAYREVAYYTPDNSFSGGNTANYPVWNMYKGWNTYNKVSYDMYISNSSLETIPFPNNDSTSAHFPLNNLTNNEILELIATDLGRVYGGNITGDVGLGQVFTLYKDAFGSLVGLMAIQVIPGITLGLLLFLPLVGTIIIVIIRLVKK